jgi:uncharacterized protein
MRLVVDTNVFVSAALKQTSWPGKTLRWVGEFDGLLTTDITEQEVVDVLRRPRIAAKIVPLFIDNLRRMFASAERVVITEPVKGCCDPDDDLFLELAVNGKADVIISGDADLLALESFRGIPIVTPAVFGHAYII